MLTSFSHLVQVRQSQNLTVSHFVRVAVVVDAAVAGGALRPGVEVGGREGHSGEVHRGPVELRARRARARPLRARHVIQLHVHEDSVVTKLFRWSRLELFRLGLVDM